MEEPQRNDWYDRVTETIERTRYLLRRVRMIRTGKPFRDAMIELFGCVSSLSKFLAMTGGSYALPDIRRELATFRDAWKDYYMGLIPFEDLELYTTVIVSEVESTLEVASWKVPATARL